MATFGALKSTVYEILQDPAGVAWSVDAVKRSATKANRKIANVVGLNQSRLTLSMVQGQQSYEIAGTTVKRISSIRILSEAGDQAGYPLTQVQLDELPINTSEEGEPTNFVLNIISGTDGDQTGIVLWPTPARSQADAIIVDYEPNDTLTGNDAEVLPYPSVFDEARIYYTLYYMLMDREDTKDTESALKFEKMAKDEMKGIQFNSFSFSNVDVYRQMP